MPHQHNVAHGCPRAKRNYHQHDRYANPPYCLVCLVCHDLSSLEAWPCCHHGHALSASYANNPLCSTLASLTLTSTLCALLTASAMSLSPSALSTLTSLS